jgi:hypothetical protein
LDKREWKNVLGSGQDPNWTVGPLVVMMVVVTFSLGFKYSPLHPVLKCLQSMFILYGEMKFYTLIKEAKFYSDCSLLACDTIPFCRLMSVFWGNKLPAT